jgi:hypothetical protein
MIYNETVQIWLDDLVERTGCDTIDQLTREEILAEVQEVRGTISNERIWELGYDGEEPTNPHTENIEVLVEYLEVLDDMLKNKEA